MSKGKFLFLAALALFLSSSAAAWPACNGNWIQVPAGTSSAGGAIVTENGQTFQCQPVTPPTSPSNTNTNTNTNNNSSSSTSTSSATGGTATATGGNATQKQGQSQNQTASANNNSSGNTTTINSTSTESKIPVNTAYAAAPYPTAQCFKGSGVGGQAGLFGFTLNGGKIDENCAILETARAFDSASERLAACKIKISNKYAKKAGVTLEDCLSVPVPAPLPSPAPVLPPTPIIVNVPAPVINLTPTPVYIDQAPTYVPQPVYKAPKKKVNKPIGAMRPCPPSPGTNHERANCWEDD